MQKINNSNLILNSLIFSICLLPVSLLAGSSVLNFLVILISILFIFETSSKQLNFFKNDITIAITIFWFSLIINILITGITEGGLLRALGFVRFILLILAIQYVLNIGGSVYRDKIFKIWFLVFLIVSLDLIYEFFMGQNILGFSADPLPGRLAGFLNEELKIGGYYFGFIILVITYIYSKKNNNILFYFIVFSFLIVSFLIGERSNFIKVFFSIILFLIFFQPKNYFLKILVVILSLSTISTTIYVNEQFKYRYFTQFNQPTLNLSDNKIDLSQNKYFLHYKSAYQVFNDNKLFGVGIKNFRNEIKNEKYLTNNEEINRHINSTHPHQFHFEILSETGIFGYLIFLVFFLYSIIRSIKEYFKTKNLYLLASIIFIIVSLNPLLPSGSFFTSFQATIFWINFGVMTSFVGKRLNK